MLRRGRSKTAAAGRAAGPAAIPAKIPIGRAPCSRANSTNGWWCCRPRPGARAPSNSERFDLERRSLDIVAALGLIFATVTWGVDPDLAAVRLARVDPYPRADQVLPVWSECLPPLLEFLQC